MHELILFFMFVSRRHGEQLQLNMLFLSHSSVWTLCKHFLRNWIDLSSSFLNKLMQRKHINSMRMTNARISNGESIVKQENIPDNCETWLSPRFSNDSCSTSICCKEDSSFTIILFSFHWYAYFPSSQM